MECLTAAEGQEWLTSFGVKIGDNNELVFSHDGRQKGHAVSANFPTEPLKLSYFASRLIDWLPRGGQRMLWLKSWHTYPPDQTTLFETVRRGCGEERTIIEAPGHLFSWNEAAVYEPATTTSPQTKDHAIMLGLVLLVICLDWEAYLLAQDCNDHVFLGDDRVFFYAEDSKRMEEAANLAKAFQLKMRKQKERL